MSFRATCAEINLGAIAHNLQEIKKKVAPAEIMAVIKADAYGHSKKRYDTAKRPLTFPQFL